MNNEHLHDLETGTRVFHPAHGVVSVLGLEEREFGQGPQVFYVLGLARGDRILLPAAKVEKAGVRSLVSAAKARELLEKVRVAPAKTTTAGWKQRAAAYMEGLRSGSPDRYTEVLQELLYRSRSCKLSGKDKHLLELARGYFVGEISAALDCLPDDIDETVRALGKAKQPGEDDK